MSGAAIHPIGIIWYDEEDYLDARGVMIDPETLPLTYDSWLRHALNAENSLLGIGVPVLRAKTRSKIFCLVL